MHLYLEIGDGYWKELAVEAKDDATNWLSISARGQIGRADRAVGSEITRAEAKFHEDAISN